MMDVEKSDRNDATRHGVLPQRDQTVNGGTRLTALTTNGEERLLKAYETYETRVYVRRETGDAWRWMPEASPPGRPFGRTSALPP